MLRTVFLSTSLKQRSPLHPTPPLSKSWRPLSPGWPLPGWLAHSKIRSPGLAPPELPHLWSLNSSYPGFSASTLIAKGAALSPKSPRVGNGNSFTLPMADCAWGRFGALGAVPMSALLL